MTSPLSVQSQLVRQAAQQLADAREEFDFTERCLDREEGSPEIFGEYGADQQYGAFRKAWLSETKLTRRAIGQTVDAMRSAADRYDEADEAATLRVSEPGQRMGA